MPASSNAAAFCNWPVAEIRGAARRGGRRPGPSSRGGSVVPSALARGNSGPGPSAGPVPGAPARVTHKGLHLAFRPGCTQASRANPSCWARRAAAQGGRTERPELRWESAGRGWRCRCGRRPHPGPLSCPLRPQHAPASGSGPGLTALGLLPGTLPRERGGPSRRAVQAASEHKPRPRRAQPLGGTRMLTRRPQSGREAGEDPRVRAVCLPGSESPRGSRTELWLAPWQGLRGPRRAGSPG